MTDVLDTPPAPTEGEAGPVEGGNGLVDAPVSPFDYAVDDEEVAEGPELERTRWWQSESNRSLVQLALSIAVVGGCVVYVLVNIHANLILKVNTPTGGDFGAHVWGPAYLRDHILPHWRLSGWAPDWYGGFPMYKFYMVVPALVTVLLDVVLPYGVALKMVSALGLVALPVCCWAFGKLAGLPFPIPPLFAIASIFFLFDWSLHDLRRQRRFDDGGRVLLQPRPLHVDAVPRRARPGHADGQGARPRGRALCVGGPLPPDRRHLRHGGHRC